MNAPAQRSIETVPVDLGELPQSLGFMLRMAQVVAFEQFFQKFPDGMVRPGEFSVLWVIGLNPDVRQGDVAQALNIKRAHMTKLVQRLIKSGLVRRKVPPEDRRSVLLSLTDKGRAEVEAQRDAFLALHAAEASRLTRREFDTLLRLLGKFAGLERDVS